MENKKVNISDNLFVSGNLHAPRRLTPLGQKYSIFVKTIKYFFLVLAFLVFGTLLFQMSDTEQLQPSSKSADAEAVRATPGQIELVGAKYEGVDEKGNPYTITAERANRSSEVEDGVLFENPLTDIVLNDNSWLALKSIGGFFDRFSKNLIMEDGVIAYHDSGYEINMRDIVINLQEKSGSTASPVSIQGPIGSAHAQNMEVVAGAEKIIFGGPVNIKIFDLALIRR